jgi:hypothetical protein
VGGGWWWGEERRSGSCPLIGQTGNLVSSLSPHFDILL